MNFSAFASKAAALLHIAQSVPSTVAADAGAISTVLSSTDAAEQAVSELAGPQTFKLVTAGEALFKEAVAFAQSKAVQDAEAVVSGLFSLIGHAQVKAAEKVAGSV